LVELYLSINQAINRDEFVERFLQDMDGGA